MNLIPEYSAPKKGKLFCIQVEFASDDRSNKKKKLFLSRETPYIVLVHTINQNTLLNMESYASQLKFSHHTL